jgi:hypothetical protein
MQSLMVLVVVPWCLPATLQTDHCFVLTSLLKKVFAFMFPKVCYWAGDCLSLCLGCPTQSCVLWEPWVSRLHVCHILNHFTEFVSKFDPNCPGAGELSGLTHNNDTFSAHAHGASEQFQAMARKKPKTHEKTGDSCLFELLPKH